MKIRFLAAGLFLSAAMRAAQAAIILDEAPREPEMTKPRIGVPDPKDKTKAKEPAPPATDLLRFTNNDTLHGFLLAFKKDDGIRWSSPEAKEPIVFKTDAVAEIKLDSRKPPESAANATHAIGLTNDDELPGTIVSLDDKTLVLDTWYAGQLSIPRAMLRRISPLQATASTVYEGPTGMEGWVQGRSGNRKSWTYRDGALIGTNYGTIGRDVKLPPVASVEFDMVFRGNSQVSICLYSDRTDNISNCYMFQMNNNYVSLQRYSRDGGSNSIGESAQIGEMIRREKVRVAIRVNKETKTFSLFIEGKLLKQWTDPAVFAGAGTSLIFNGQSGTFIKISNLKVSHWDGRIEEPRRGTGKTKEDTMKLANQDKVSGKLKTIEKGRAQFASSYADLTIPLERMEEIVMSSEGADQAKRSDQDVRAHFASRGAMTVQLESWDEKQAIASSANFGRATFLPDAFQRLQFNLDRAKPAEEELEEAAEE